jgi:hypothetical protein
LVDADHLNQTLDAMRAGRAIKKSPLQRSGLCGAT